MAHPTVMVANETALLVVDVQEKLMVKIPQADALVRDIAFLIDAANLAGVEVLATEQYRLGFGRTVAALPDRCRARPARVPSTSGAVAGLPEGRRHPRR